MRPSHSSRVFPGRTPLRILDKGKTEPRTLLEGGDYASPSFSASGDTIVFEERAKSARMRMPPVKGGTPRTVVEGLQPGTRPQLSQDGKFVTFTSRNAVLRVPVAGGRSRTATRLPWPVRDAAFSPPTESSSCGIGTTRSSRRWRAS